MNSRCFEVDGVVKGQAVKAIAVQVGDYSFEVLPKTPSTEAQDCQEVSGLLNRMVHYVAFQHTVIENERHLLSLEDFQKQCWDRERERECLEGTSCHLSECPLSSWCILPWNTTVDGLCQMVHTNKHTTVQALVI